MMDLNAVLGMGQRKLIFPGTESCKIVTGKDACVLDLEISLSGHLILPVDQLDKLPRSAVGLPKSMALFVNSGEKASMYNSAAYSANYSSGVTPSTSPTFSVSILPDNIAKSNL